MATKLSLRNSASDINPTADVEKYLSPNGGTVAPPGVAATTNTVAGPTAGVQLTATGGGSKLCWFSSPLNAVTISGTITFNLWGDESNMGANACYDVLVERCSGTGTVLSTIVR